MGCLFFKMSPKFSGLKIVLNRKLNEVKSIYETEFVNRPTFFWVRLGPVHFSKQHHFWSNELDNPGQKILGESRFKPGGCWVRSTNLFAIQASFKQAKFDFESIYLAEDF